MRGHQAAAHPLLSRTNLRSRSRHIRSTKAITRTSSGITQACCERRFGNAILTAFARLNCACSRRLVDQARAILYDDSKPPIQTHLPRPKDSLKNSPYPLCRQSPLGNVPGEPSSGFPPIFLAAKHRLHQLCFVSQRFVFSWAAANEREACHGTLARPVKLSTVCSRDLKNNA
jgi:hypothetical protein